MAFVAGGFCASVKGAGDGLGGRLCAGCMDVAAAAVCSAGVGGRRGCEGGNNCFCCGSRTPEGAEGLAGRPAGIICPSQVLFWAVEVVPVVICGAGTGGLGGTWGTCRQFQRAWNESRVEDTIPEFVGE